MAREFARSFYKSAEWQKVREYCMMRESYLCKKCGQPAEEVHHIIHLTPDNIYDPSITLNPDNLVCLCKACHFEEHYGDKGNGHTKTDRPQMPEIIFDENGFPMRKDTTHQK